MVLTILGLYLSPLENRGAVYKDIRNMHIIFCGSRRLHIKIRKICALSPLEGQLCKKIYKIFKVFSLNFKKFLY